MQKQIDDLFKIYDLLDELSVLFSLLNRQIAKENYQQSYRIGREINLKLSYLIDILTMLNIGVSYGNSE
jgi:hypothetical protein